MKEILASITSKGQVTIPKDVRERLGVGELDKIAFILADDGTVTLQVPTYPSIASLRGAAGSLQTPRSWDDMRQIARKDRFADTRWENR